MSVQEFRQRLAARVPHPRLHLIRFHGVLAALAKLRAAIVPGRPEAACAEPVHEHTQHCARMSWTRLLKRLFDIERSNPRREGGVFINHGVIDRWLGGR